MSDKNTNAAFIPESINDTFHRFSKKADNLYFFVALYSNYISRLRSYGVGPELTMTESHMLNSIAETPGVTVTELAKRWERTTGAVCQTLSKLTAKGLIRKDSAPGNAKNVLLYPTELGSSVDRAHMMFDIADITETFQELMENCTMEEIDTFFKVLELYLELIRKDLSS